MTQLPSTEDLKSILQTISKILTFLTNDETRRNAMETSTTGLVNLQYACESLEDAVTLSQNDSLPHPVVRILASQALQTLDMYIGNDDSQDAFAVDTVKDLVRLQKALNALADVLQDKNAAYLIKCIASYQDEIALSIAIQPSMPHVDQSVEPSL